MHMARCQCGWTGGEQAVGPMPLARPQLHIRDDRPTDELSPEHVQMVFVLVALSIVLSAVAFIICGGFSGVNCMDDVPVRPPNRRSRQSVCQDFCVDLSPIGISELLQLQQRERENMYKKL